MVNRNTDPFDNPETLRRLKLIGLGLSLIAFIVGMVYLVGRARSL